MSGSAAAHRPKATEEMIDRWSSEYRQGALRNEGIPVGRPPLSVRGTVQLNVKVPVELRELIDRRAREHGLSMSSYVRQVLADSVVAG